MLWQGASYDRLNMTDICRLKAIVIYNTRNTFLNVQDKPTSGIGLKNAFLPSEGFILGTKFTVIKKREMTLKFCIVSINQVLMSWNITYLKN